MCTSIFHFLTKWPMVCFDRHKTETGWGKILIPWKFPLFSISGMLISSYLYIPVSYFALCYCCSAKSLQSCPTLCDPTDSSPPGSAFPGILQARTLEWVAISFSNAWKWKVKVKSLSCSRLLATPWTAAYQAPLSMGFSWQEYWTGLSLPSPKQWC